MPAQHMRLGEGRRPRVGESNVMIGTRVGPFTIVCPLDEAGRGRMYLAEHAVLKTRRSVKLLALPPNQNALVTRRFIDDVRAAAQLHHRNLIRIHDAGQLASGAWFVVLDHLEGETLARLMAGHAGPMSPDLIIQIVSEIANGLTAAHDHEIAHRDLTPDSVFLIHREGDPHHVVLLDVGCARFGDASAVWPKLAALAIGAGPPCGAYRPPELRGGEVGPAADVFALGVIAYQMSTGGWFPYQHGESRSGYGELARAELHRRQLVGPAVDPRDRAPGLPEAWADVLLAAVSADPDRRPATARALALGLAEALPAANGSPGGLAIVRTYARELLDTGPELDGAHAPRPSAMPAADLGSRYQLGDKLGTGGMAEVFSATMVGAEGFARQVAIKRVLTGLSRIPAFAEMFVSEARIASRLAHPNIVSVLDFARDAEGRLYLVMEYVDGKDLASLLATGPIHPAIANFITVEMLRALGYAHGASVVHRDVSPQNLLLSYEGAVKVSDFGLAKVRAASGGVRSDVVRGKPSYMSPEQVSGELLDGRADLYAVGVMLWEMLAHRPLFAGTAREITAQVMFKDIARPSSYCSTVPADLEAVAMTLLAHDREDRYATAAAAIEALLGCADVSRDGRGELAQLLAVRLRPGRDGRDGRAQREPAAAEPRGPRLERITAATPSSLEVDGAMRPRRGRFTATLCVIAIAGAVAALLARGEVARPRIPDRAAPPRSPAPVPGKIAAPAPPAPIDAGAGDAGQAPALPQAQAPDAATPRTPPHRERVAPIGHTGELVIIVRPWAMIWLNGKPSGQTPFRSAVPAGRYRVRLANDDAGHDEVTTVTVESDQTATVERSW